MNIIWRERHPETAVMVKSGPQTWWHQFRLGWSRWRVTTLFDVTLQGWSVVETARYYDDAIYNLNKHG